MNTKVAIVVGVLILAAAGWYVSQEKPVTPQVQVKVPEGAIVVELTKEGFSPSELTIAKGESVTFRTTGTDLYWPASNLHPSHGIYPEFDPLKPLQPTEVWSFTFDQVGEWKYHDHLAPYFTGVITVTE
ncbi:cupredoxin domain-containing protein [Patescibacteria group bacterium]|nr:cupredoxin domain-containing protein [Patescibacteria group bacterium]